MPRDARAYLWDIQSAAEAIERFFGFCLILCRHNSLGLRAGRKTEVEQSSKSAPQFLNRRVEQGIRASG